jgi:hypothetical protein
MEDRRSGYRGGVMTGSLGIRGTYAAIKSANGTGQNIAAALVGLTYAGMPCFFVPTIALYLWTASSLAVLMSTIWLSKAWLARALTVNFLVSCVVLSFYLLHDLAPSSPIYYVMKIDGMDAVSRSNHRMPLMDSVSYGLGCIIVATWSLYLSNLAHRQMFEAERFEHSGEKKKPDGY